MIIRPIQASDNSQIAKVIRDTLREFGVDKPGTVFTDPTTDDLFSLFQTEKSAYFVLREGSEILGGCGIYPTTGLPDACTELVKLYLVKHARNKGLGKKLMKAAMQHAKVLGYKQVYLESLPELKNAITLYQKMGFEKINHSLGNSGHFACDLWMIKHL